MNLTEQKPLLELVTQAMDMQKRGRLQESFAIYAHILSQYNYYAGGWFLSGLVLRDLGDLEGATMRLSRAIALEADHGEWHLELGHILKLRGKTLAALDRFQEAIRLAGDHAQAHFFLGDTYVDLGQVDNAIPCFERAVGLQPDLDVAWNNLGLCFKVKQQFDRALDCFDRAIQLNGEQASYHVNKALALLTVGRMEEGFLEYEWRLAMEPVQVVWPVVLPRWQGEAISGQRVLVTSEQGFGDNLQFIRYLPVLRERFGAVVYFSCLAGVVPLLQGHPEWEPVLEQGVCQGMAADRFRAMFDVQIPLMSLPGVLYKTLSNKSGQLEPLPIGVPYLRGDPLLCREWQERLEGEGLKVGLVWEGKPLHRHDPMRRRSCSLTDLRRLALVSGCRFFSLQKGKGSVLEQEMAWLTDLSSYLTDFSCTAAIVENLDLVITIDTSVAHLAGALGRPVWTLLPVSADWRWFLESEASPWYPTMRLFRKSGLESWSDVVERLAQALEQKVDRNSL
ncbi:MAG: tetratricopeptide repeat-containing glycosyltransferase family protein [Magnetococcus sp. DMHC-6]